MKMDLVKMLDKCRKGQWSVDDFDWTQKPKVQLTKEQEIRVCQYYLDMSYIERLAGALFFSLSKRFDDDSELKGIYETFYVDELRHSHAAAKLMDYFDVHKYKFYTPNPAMLKFIPYFTRAVDSLNPAFANSFITGGEFILDIALLRSLNDYVDDPLSRAVVDKINQDESRHIAMDLFMTQYCSEHRMARGTGDKRKFWQKPDFWGVITWSWPFFDGVFFRPMQIMDPSNYRMTEVLKRLRRFNMRPEVQNNPTVKNFNDTVEFLESPVGSRVGTATEKAIKMLTGIDFSWVRSASTANLNRKQPGVSEEALGGERLHEELTLN